MIDSHCHLDHEPMFSDLKNVITRSKDSGVEKILSICTTNDSFHKIVEINEKDRSKALLITAIFSFFPITTPSQFFSTI